MNTEEISSESNLTESSGTVVSGAIKRSLTPGASDPESEWPELPLIFKNSSYSNFDTLNKSTNATGNSTSVLEDYHSDSKFSSLTENVFGFSAVNFTHRAVWLEQFASRFDHRKFTRTKLQMHAHARREFDAVMADTIAGVL